MNWVLRFGFGKGVVLIDASLVCLESVPNFHDENLAAFRLIFMAEIRQGFALVYHSTQNIILTKLSLWEYDNGEAQFSWWKSGRVLRLVRYGAPAVFHAYAYDACQHACARTSRNPSKHQAYWRVSHTRGKQCHSDDMDWDNHILMTMHAI